MLDSILTFIRVNSNNDLTELNYFSNSLKNSFPALLLLLAMVCQAGKLCLGSEQELCTPKRIDLW